MTDNKKNREIDRENINDENINAAQASEQSRGCARTGTGGDVKDAAGSLRRYGSDRKFEVVSEYTPSGDQPQAIEKISRAILSGMKEQVLLGATGSGKTYTMAKVIERVQRPTLVLAHNKTLAAQLCSEFREFFPNFLCRITIIISRRHILPRQTLI